MENASKALIIAGAILLSILIIGLGMMIYQQAAGAMDGAGMDKEKIATYNSEFEAYTGNNQSGASVKSLYDVVKNHNITNQSDETLTIKINDKSTTADLNKAKTEVKAGKTYTVKVADDGYDSKTGFITKIVITENK